MTTSDTRRKVTPFMDNEVAPRAPLSQAHYASREWHDRDVEAVFKKRWLFAGHPSQIAKPGEYFTFGFADESVIVSRTKTGEIRAFHNSCRHRGAQVCQQASGRTKYFVCPFHGWAYNLDGSLKLAPELPGLDTAQYPLKPVWVEEWEGLIFLNLSAEKPGVSVAETFSHIDFSAYQLERTKVIADKVYEVEANWKIAGETYNECYHCALRHPELLRVIRTETVEEWSEAPQLENARERDFLIWTPDAGPGMREGARTFSMDGQMVSKRLLGAGDVELPCAALSWFPNLGYFVNPDHTVVSSWLPAGPRKSLFRATWSVHEDAVEGVDYEVDEVVRLIDITNEQDKELCRLVQLGVNSSGYDNSAPYHPQHEAPVRGFLQAYLDHVKPGRPAVGEGGR
jgi:Rieske 2Fe-2S family protein